MKIKFCRAVTGVTGSCHMISAGGHKILLDCGLFQGGRESEQMNLAPFPFNPAEIECVVVSHAHVDHVGRLPLLVKQGFKGSIYATDATADLLDVILKDCAHIQEQDSEWENKRAKRAGKPQTEPLYSMDDAKDALDLIVPKRYDQLFEINDSMKVVFNDAGHILGSAIVELFVTENDETTKLVFSGDLGMPDRPILKDPKIIKKADVLIMETTYGDRVHEENAISVSKLVETVESTVKRGGNVIIPSFAVGRTQELLFELNKIYDGAGPDHDALINIPVYVDSPMAARATEVFKQNAQSYDEEAKAYIVRGDNPFEFKNLHFISTSEESRALNMDDKPKIIISASGMCDAGRIRHHLKHNLWSSKNTVIFVGYQADGTLGRRLLSGEQTVTLFGEEVAVKAKIVNIEGFSGHADRNGLLNWLSGFHKKPGRIFFVHGEDEAKEAFADLVYASKGWDTTIVNSYREYDIAEGSVLDGESPEHEFVSEEEVDHVRARLAKVHDSLDSILYGTSLAISKDLPKDKLTEIKNSVADLEKEVMDLGALVSK